MFSEIGTGVEHSPAKSSGRGVTIAHAGEIESVIGTITLAFSTDPVARWMYPDPFEFMLHFPRFVRSFARCAVGMRGIYRTSGFEGAALWLAPDVTPVEEELVGLFWDSVSEEIQPDLFTVFEQMGAAHPAGPHWYLPMIGVDTRAQGRGFGSQLLSEALDRCDAEGLPAYLESSNPRNIQLYERFGFEPIGTIQAGSSPELVPMLRQARPRDDKN